MTRDDIILRAQTLLDAKGSYNTGPVCKELAMEYGQWHQFITDIAKLKPRPTQHRTCRIVNMNVLPSPGAEKEGT